MIGCSRQPWIIVYGLYHDTPVLYLVWMRSCCNYGLIWQKLRVEIRVLCVMLCIKIRIKIAMTKKNQKEPQADENRFVGQLLPKKSGWPLTRPALLEFWKPVFRIQRRFPSPRKVVKEVNKGDGGREGGGQSWSTTLYSIGMTPPPQPLLVAVCSENWKGLKEELVVNVPRKHDFSSTPDIALLDRGIGKRDKNIWTWTSSTLNVHPF